MEERKQTKEEAALARRTLADLALMLSLSVILVAAAWLWIPQPLVEDPVQTELLCIQVQTADHGTALWKPKTVVERQTARAIVDHMATLRKQNTLRTARSMEQRPDMYVHFRTEDLYQVVALGDVAGGKEGISYARDGRGLTAQVLQPQELEDYIRTQLHTVLPHGGGQQF